MNAYANVENNFILDYFYYKKVPSVVGFSCNSEQDDLSLARNFNKIGITVALSKLDYEYQTYRFVQATYWKLGIFLDLRCYDIESIISVLTDASDYRMFDELHYWLVLGWDIDNVTMILDDRAFGLSTDFVIAVPSIDGGYQLYDVYNIWKEAGGILRVTFMGTWNLKSQLSVELSGSKFSRRANLYGMTLRASFYASKYKPVDMALEDYLQDYATTPKDGLSKFGFIIVTHLSEMFNFSIQRVVVAKWKVGDSLGPIVRALNYSEIDITGSPVTMSVPRTYLVKYVHQAWPFRTCFIFRSPQKTNIKIHELLRPLDMEVWYLAAALFILCVWVMSALFRYESFTSTILRYSNALLVTFGALCQQGTDIKMNYIATRIAFLCIMIFSVLFYTYYSASVVSARLSDPIFKVNDSLNELAKMDLKLASEWMVYFELFIKKKDWETQMFYKKRWAQVPEADQFMQPEKAIQLVQQGGFAYHMHPDVGYPFINQLYDNREICELMEVHLAKPTYSTFAVTFNSTFVEMMRTGLTKIAEVGLRQRQVSRWTSRKPRCQRNVLSASSVTIYEFAPHLLILVIGIAVAVMMLIVEVTLSGHNDTRRLKSAVKAAIFYVRKQK